MFIGGSSASPFGGMPFVEDTKYQCDHGLGLIALEEAENMMAFLKADVIADCKEHQMIQEGASEYEMEVFYENVLTSAWEKIKEWLRKLWNKIRNYFKAFIAKLENFFGKNGYDYYKKYEKVINSTDVKIEDLYVKYKAYKQNGFDMNDVSITTLLKDTDIDKIYNLDPEKIKEEIDDDDEVLKSITKNQLDDAANIKKDMEDKMFEDVDTKYEVKMSNIHTLLKGITDKNVLKDAEDIVKKIEKDFKDLEKFSNKLNQDVIKHMKDNNGQYSDAATSGTTFKTRSGITINGKYVGKDSDGHDVEKGISSHQGVGIFRSVVSRSVSMFNKVASAYLACVKEHIAQSRRIASTIVSYKLRHAKGKIGESALLEAAIDEVIEF